jgi:hypothetical protein
MHESTCLAVVVAIAQQAEFTLSPIMKAAIAGAEARGKPWIAPQRTEQLGDPDRHFGTDLRDPNPHVALNSPGCPKNVRFGMFSRQWIFVAARRWIRGGQRCRATGIGRSNIPCQWRLFPRGCGTIMSSTSSSRDGIVGSCSADG